MSFQDRFSICLLRSKIYGGGRDAGLTFAPGLDSVPTAPAIVSAAGFSPLGRWDDLDQHDVRLCNFTPLKSENSRRCTQTDYRSGMIRGAQNTGKQISILGLALSWR